MWDLQTTEQRDGWARFVGATIKSTTFKPLCESFNIVTDKGTATLKAEGDCCSQSCFTDFDWKDLRGCPVVTAKMRPEEVAQYETSGGNDHRKIYGIDFKTEYATAYLEMRNDSNGYYGGECVISWEG